MNRRLSQGLTLMAAGVLVLFLAASQVWFRRGGVTWKGSQDRGFTALALGVLAAGAALLATRGWGRRLVAVLAVVLGLGIVGLVVRSLGDRATLLAQPGHPVALAADHAAASTSAWPVLAIAAGVLVVLGALLAVLAGDRTALSARHEAPTSKPAETVEPPRDFADVAAWQALDRDEDPTGT